jgi:hypothetical protein
MAASIMTESVQYRRSLELDQEAVKANRERDERERRINEQANREREAQDQTEE